MFHIVLFEPEIPPNTGNVMRLCANTGTQLHLIQPLGFALEDKQLRRAGLDYKEWASIEVHAGLDEFLVRVQPRRLFAFSTRAHHIYTETAFMPADVMLFGPETRGLPQAVLERVPARQRLRLPMVPGNRSLNLSNAVAVVIFEAWRQQGFIGAHSPIVS